MADGFNVTNGKTRHAGVEFSFLAPLTDWLSASGEWAVADQRYDFDQPANNIVDGARIDTAPVTLGTFRLSADWDQFGAEIEWRHVGEYFTDEANTQTYPGHDIAVLRANYAVTEAMTFFGRVDNLFDAKYADRADFAFGNERYFPGRPRTLFMGLTVEY